jgi:hypothetical protein
VAHPCPTIDAFSNSTYYLTSRFTPGKLPKDEPLHQFIPLIEFASDTPRREKTTATMNPGLAYVADTWQVAARSPRAVLARFAFSGPFFESVSGLFNC